jgi:hypothetical protein
MTIRQNRLALRIVGLMSAALLSACVTAPGAPVGPESSDAVTVAEKLAINNWGQYMAQNCRPETVRDWEAFPTTLCEYRSRTVNKTVPVVMLNADNARLASWIVTACQDAGSSNVMECAERLAVQIRCQSNNQFPVAGFVDEGTLYMFRDGITVSIAGVDTGSDIGLARMPTDAEQRLVLQDGTVSRVYQWARVQATGRQAFASYVGRPVAEFEGVAWATAIRREYQAAWTSSRNRLLSAWAVANASRLNTSTGFSTFLAQACPANAAWIRWS